VYKSLQACRGYAALLVVLYHLGLAIGSPKYFGIRQFGLPFGFGDSGVVFFFVLSGFIITWVHFADIGTPSRLLPYLRKRAVRIFPTYWIVLAAVFLLAVAMPAFRSTVPHDFPTLLKTFALVPQEPAVVGGTGAPILIVAWSLQYEICFYCWVGVFILSPALGFLVTGAFVANFLGCRLGSCSFPRSFLSNPVILLFAYGALIAYGSRSPIRMKRPSTIAATAAGAFLVLGMAEVIWGQQSLPIDRRLAYGLVSGILILSLVRAEDANPPAAGKGWSSLLGDSSYALYLIHFPLISALCKLAVSFGLTGPWGALVAYISILCACVAGAIAFHLRLEKPLLRVLSGTKKSGPMTRELTATPP